MASSPFLALLLLLALAAAQPLPPQQQPARPTNASDAAALRAVFRQWGFLDAEGVPPPPPPAVAEEDPCAKLVWFQSFARSAYINCSCSDLTTNECRITHLNVTGYWNITEIPPALFGLAELVSLDLSNNNLSGSIPADIANLSKLETWHFNNNQLGGPIPNESSSLMNLHSLWMFDNNLEGVVPEFIANFTNLTDLRLYGMKLRGPIPKIFSKLINIKNLMLGDLHGGNSSFGFVASWANLSTLSLRKCGISGQLPSSPPNLPKLAYLDLRSNNLSGPIELLLPYDKNTYLYVGENNLSGRLPTEIVPSSLALDVSYNPFLIGNLDNPPAGPKQSINYIGTSIDSKTTDSEILALLNCPQMKGCGTKYFGNTLSSFSVNCGGKQTNYSDPLSNVLSVFYDDPVDLRPAGFHVGTDRHLVVSHVGSDPFNYSPGIVNTSRDFFGIDMPDLYKTARTSTGALWYYVVGLANGKYTVQLFFAEIVIESEPGRRLFNIDIQDQNVRTDFDIFKEAGGSGIPINITHEVNVDNSVLKIHLYWNGRGTCCIPYRGAYGPLVSAIRVFRPEDVSTRPPPSPTLHPARDDEKRRGVVAGIAALCIAATVISSSVVYLWWKWVSLVKRSAS